MDDDAAEKWAGLVASLLPNADVAREDRWRSLHPVTEFLAGRYGRWACGWNWSVGERDVDGGVVEVPRHPSRPGAARLSARSWADAGRRRGPCTPNPYLPHGPTNPPLDWSCTREEPTTPKGHPAPAPAGGVRPAVHHAQDAERTRARLEPSGKASARTCLRPGAPADHVVLQVLANSRRASAMSRYASSSTFGQATPMTSSSVSPSPPEHWQSRLIPPPRGLCRPGERGPAGFRGAAARDPALAPEDHGKSSASTTKVTFCPF